MFTLTNFSHSILKLLDKLLFTAGCVELAQVDSHQLGPIHCLWSVLLSTDENVDAIDENAGVHARSSFVTGTCSYFSIILPGMLCN